MGSGGERFDCRVVDVGGFVADRAAGRLGRGKRRLNQADTALGNGSQVDVRTLGVQGLEGFGHVSLL